MLDITLPQRPEWLAPLDDPRNETILSAAFEVFVEKGLDGATMADVAARARVSKETLYSRFDSKGGLFYALLAWGARRLPSPLQAIESGDFSDPVEALRVLARECLTIMLKPESIAVYRLVISIAERMPEVVKVYYDFSCGESRPMFERVARALVAEGAIVDDDIDVLVDAFQGLLAGNRLHEIKIGLKPIPSEAEIARDAERAAQLFLKAFAPS